ncbi:MAG: Positive regulator of CheA protein [Myxococcaceae bacterium]|nr:Positive regulator of CheA protein [Myxococcaceae bacterium]
MTTPPDHAWDDATRALLDARTRAVAARSTLLGRSDLHDALGLRVAGEQYAIAAHAIRGVAAVSRLTALPHAPPEVAGLIARGGEIIPAFHLRVVLGLPLGALPEYGRIVLMGDGADALALVVDAVEHLGAIEPDELREPPDGIAPSVRAFLRGVDRRGIPLIDHDALLASPRLYVEIPVPREAVPRPAATARKNPR